MKNIHKQPALYIGFATAVFGLFYTFVQQHCTIAPEDLITLVIGVATYAGGYFKGKGNQQAQ